MTKPRKQIVSLEDTSYYHCMARCVRRAYLFGDDPFTGRNYDHRKQWVVDQVALLANIFAIDVCAYAVMSNHTHLVLRVDQEKAQQWSAHEVITRWHKIFSGNLLSLKALKDAEELNDAENLLLGELVEKWRERLMDISWFMRRLNETIARMANEEDGVKGRFWEGRFKSQALLDEAAILSCMIYVDLNPIRAGICDLPEDSDFTSIQDRLLAMAERKVGRPKKTRPKKTQAKNSSSTQTKEKQTIPLAKFCTPPKKHFELKPDQATHTAKGKASNAIPFYWLDYMALLDWTGRAIRDDKKGYIPGYVPHILVRMGVDPDSWLDSLPKIEAQFTEFMGKQESIRELSQRSNKKWLKGIGFADKMFSGLPRSLQS